MSEALAPTATTPARRPLPAPLLPPIAEGVKFTWIPPNASKLYVDHELLWMLILPTSAALCLSYWKLGLPLPQCNLKRITSIPCVTCGATRSFELIVGKLDIIGAFLMNPLVFLGFLAIGLYLAYSAVVLAFKLPRLRVQIAGRAAWRVRHFIILAFLLNWIYVIAMGR